MKRNKHIGTFGTVIHGTMREEDLIPAFASELRSLARKGTKHKALALEAERYLKRFQSADVTLTKKPSSIFTDTYKNAPSEEELNELVTELMDALNEYAPAYGYFGAHPGDGSDYGFWLSESFEEDFDGLKVSDTSEVPRGYKGELAQVSDHGNVTLLVANGRGKFREVWGLV